MWLFYISLHLVGFVGYNLLLRKSVLNKIDNFTLATLMQTGAFIPVLLYLPFYRPDKSIFEMNSILWMLGCVVLVIALHFTNVKSLQYLETSVYSIVYNLRIVFTTVIGVVFLSESLVWLRFLGGLLIFLAIFIIRQKGSSAMRKLGLMWGLLAALSISFLNYVEKTLIDNVGLENYLPIVTLLTTAIMWIVLLVRKQKIDLTILDKNTISLMIFRAISAYAFIFALATGGLLSVSNYLSGLSIILMVIFGAIFLGETDYLKRKILATSVAAIGLTLIFMTNVL